MCGNNITYGFIFFVFVLANLSCGGNNKKDVKENLQQEISFAEISIGGMTCTGCEQKIQKNLGKLDGIKSVKASFTSGNAKIEYITEKVDSVKIKEAVIGSGYTVKKFVNVQPEPVVK